MGSPNKRWQRGKASLPLAALGLVSAVVLAACGGGTPGSSSSSPGGADHTVVYAFGVAGTKGKVAQTQHDTPTPIHGISGSVVQIATSNSTTYALTSSGTVYAWGVASLDELGNGTAPAYTSTAEKVDFPSGVRITKLANPMPFDAAMAIDATGDLWAWGLNGEHDLCEASPSLIPRPTKVDLSQVTLATGARTHSLVYAKGTLYACGNGANGQLGTGDTTSVTKPTPVIGLPKGKVKALTSSWGGSGALMESGAYYDWGYNRTGQLGVGSTADSPFPDHVILPSAVTQVFQGGSGPDNGQTQAILTNGSQWAWGSGRWGQLGNQSTGNEHLPVQITLPNGANAASVASGGYASYAVDTSGGLWAWGRNNDGQLGTGRTEPLRRTPVQLHITARQVSSTAQNVAVLSGS